MVSSAYSFYLLCYFIEKGRCCYFIWNRVRERIYFLRLRKKWRYSSNLRFKRMRIESTGRHCCFVYKYLWLALFWNIYLSLFATRRARVFLFISRYIFFFVSVFFIYLVDSPVGGDDLRWPFLGRRPRSTFPIRRHIFSHANSQLTSPSVEPHFFSRSIFFSISVCPPIYRYRACTVYYYRRLGIECVHVVAFWLSAPCRYFSFMKSRRAHALQG